MFSREQSHISSQMSIEFAFKDKKTNIYFIGYEPLNLENGSFVNGDNFDAINSRL